MRGFAMGVAESLYLPGSAWAFATLETKRTWQNLLDGRF
jgi:hypothetical protein